MMYLAILNGGIALFLAAVAAVIVYICGYYDKEPIMSKEELDSFKKDTLENFSKHYNG